ncbi:hypothetical protein [Gordonia sp. NPDC003376]
MNDQRSRGPVAALLGLPGQIAGAAVAMTQESLAVTIRTVVETFTASVDMTALIVDNIDLNRVIGAVDLDVVLAGVDLDALLARLDLDALLTRIDLDALIGRLDLGLIVDALDIDAVIDKVDVGAIIDRVDIGAIIDRVDVDAVVAKVDIDQIIARIDLIGLADDIIDGVDLPSIIRDASTSVTSDVVDDVRGTSERADDAVADLINRILRRKVEQARAEAQEPTDG